MDPCDRPPNNWPAPLKPPFGYVTPRNPLHYPPRERENEGPVYVRALRLVEPVQAELPVFPVRAENRPEEENRPLRHAGQGANGETLPAQNRRPFIRRSSQPGQPALVVDPRNERDWPPLHLAREQMPLPGPPLQNPHLVPIRHLFVRRRQANNDSDGEPPEDPIHPAPTMNPYPPPPVPAAPAQNPGPFQSPMDWWDLPDLPGYSFFYDANTQPPQ